MVTDLILDNTKRKYSVDERILYQNTSMICYLKKRLQGKHLSEWLVRNGIKEVVLYAVTEYTELFILDFENEINNKVLCNKICDREYENYANGYMNKAVISIDELVKIYLEHKDICIIVCSLYHCNEIFDDLMSRGISLQNIISASNIIFNYE